jgi:predicted GNAT family N-acyltransferase
VVSEPHDIRVEEVDLSELPACHRIRLVVFVEGQQVPESLEIDGLDEQCRHFLARAGSQPVGTARLRFVDGLGKAERVAVLNEHRGAGVGAALMAAVEECARAEGCRELLLHAQQAVIPFYRGLGYREEGELFDEADIVHQTMRKQLAARANRA